MQIMIKLKFALDGEKKDLFRSNEMILSKNERIDQRRENSLVGKQSFERSVFSKTILLIFIIKNGNFDRVDRDPDGSKNKNKILEFRDSFMKEYFFFSLFSNVFILSIMDKNTNEEKVYWI